MAKNKEKNVLSYYAINNSIDGQPVIDMVNVFRFFPVYTYRNDIDTVTVTIYYGTEIFSKQAIPCENGKYWEIVLPKFDFNQSIQRYEVETKMALDTTFRSSLSLYGFQGELKEKQKFIESLKKISQSAKSDLLRKKQGSIANSASEKASLQKETVMMKSVLDSYDTLVSSNVVEEFTERYDSAFTSIATQYSDATNKLGIEKQNDKIRVRILKDLSDTSASGKGVLIGDIELYDNNRRAAILYRNYNPENRRLPALDPAERVSIYRIRYVPFPIVGDKLRGPFEKTVPIVFEAGLSFGNVTVTNNDNVISQFSFQRFGICIALTPQLFSEYATIKAIALSYDFNAYASVSFGANFGTLSGSKLGSYASLGINFTAFQILMSNTKNIFK